MPSLIGLRVRVGSILQDRALLLLLLPREQRGASGVLEHFANAFVGLGGALKVLLGADLLADVFGLCSGVVSNACLRPVCSGM